MNARPTNPSFPTNRQQAVARTPVNRVRGYATHPTTAGGANLKIEV